MKCLFTTLALLILCGAGLSQASLEQYVGKYLTVEDGLSDRTVWDLTQDSRGFVWVATQNGLNRYDGYEFLNFDVNTHSKYSLSDDDVRSLTENKHQQLVIKYQDKRNYIDLLDITSHKVTHIALDKYDELKGDLLDFYTRPMGDSYALYRSVDSTELSIFKLDRDNSFEQLFTLPVEKSSHSFSLLCTTNDEYWIAGDYGSFYKLNASGNVLQQLDAQDFVQTTNGDAYSLSIFHTDRNGRLWVTFRQQPGVYLYHNGLQSFQLAPQLPQSLRFNLLFEDQEGNLLFSYLDSNISQHLWLWQTDNTTTDISRLLNWENRITSACARDFTKLILLGSHIGVVKLAARPNKVQTYIVQQLDANEWGPSFRGITGDGKGNVYFAREVKAWYHLNTSTNQLDTLQMVDPASGETSNIRLASNLVLENDSTLWGTSKIEHNSYLLRLDLPRKSWQKFSIPRNDYIVSFTQASDGLFYLATNSDGQQKRLLIFDPARKTFSTYRNALGKNPLRNLRPRHITISRKGELLIGTNDGLLIIQPTSGFEEHIKPTTLSDNANDNDIWVVHEGMDGELWLGTYGDGLIRLNRQDRTLKIFGKSQGIANEKVCGIVGDEEGNLWISTFNGISFLDTQNEQFRNFYTRDGLSYSEFNRLSYYRDADGRLYFGGLNGVNAFFADNLLQQQDTLSECLQLTRVVTFNKDSADLQTLTHNLSQINSLVLPAENRFCSFSFALTSFVSPENHQFAYKIEELDGTWNHLGNNNEIRLNYLPPGVYHLRVKAADHNGHWIEYPHIIELRAQEFFYNTWWFYGLLCVLIGGIGFFILRSLYRTRMGQQETRRLKEIDEVKDRLYANITHEFRTPLTLILGPARQLQQQLEYADAKVQRNVAVILQNGQRLLQLVNQMLDLGKLEAREMQPEYQQDNIVPYLSYITDSFQSLAASQGIELTFRSTHETIVMDFDQDKLMKIFSNLLSNALKFTSRNGEIEVAVERQQQQLLVSVKDNGIGISKEKLPYIFDRFYQADHSNIRTQEGSGIGLAFTKESVKLLGGDIYVESIEKEGSRFTIVLPIHREAPLVKSARIFDPIIPPAPSPQVSSNNFVGQDDVPIVLIIEDNPDVAQFIADSICPAEQALQYRVLFAEDGEIGLEKAIEHIPDLIISDVMMPKRDGYELCQILKNDERTSHIPIILLTARTAIEDRLQGLQQGANAYLEKPFHETEIRLQVENMLNLRRELQQRYSAPDNLIQEANKQMHHSDSPSNFNLQMEDAFVQKVLGIIHEYLSDMQFSVTKLAEEVSLSKSQLNRKLSAVTDFTPAQLIRYVRLKKAKELLGKSDIIIADVAYQTGFSDPSYFTRIFTKEFGITPSDFKKEVAR